MYLYLIICLETSKDHEDWKNGQCALYLPAHRERKEDAEVHDEDRPVDRDVEHLGEGAEERQHARACRRQPGRKRHMSGERVVAKGPRERHA